MCVCVCAVRRRKAALTEVRKAPTPGADTDGLSEIQQCGNWRRSSYSHMKSHLLSVPRALLLLLVLYTLCKEEQGQQTCREKYILREQTVSFQAFLASPSLHYNNSYCSGYFTAVYVQWGMLYMRSCFNHNSLTGFEWVNSTVISKLLSFCLVLSIAYPALPVRFEDLLICFARRCGCPFLALSLLWMPFHSSY